MGDVDDRREASEGRTGGRADAVRRTALLLRDALGDYRRDRASSLGAAIAFYTVLSMAPLFIVSVGIATLFAPIDVVHHELLKPVRALAGTAGEEVATILSNNALRAFRERPGPMPTALVVMVLLFAASAVLTELRRALDVVWEVQPVHSGQLRRALLQRLVSIALVLALGFVLAASLLLSAALGVATTLAGARFEPPAAYAGAIESLVNLIVLAALFAVLYRYVPDVRLGWRDVLPGAAVAAALFVVAKWGLGLLLGRSVIAASYGAAGSLVIFLVWVFIFAQIFLYCAEVVKIYARRHGTLRDARGTGPPGAR